MSLVAGAFLWVWRGPQVPHLLGDTDDALRLVLVRDLISGRSGWWDQHLTRLQPPLGMDLHWSRLIDGGIAGLEWLLRLFLSPGQAETVARTAWPFLWLLPAIASALVIARAMKGAMGAVLCTALLMVNVMLYAQWAPGRIDHHDVQIALCLVTLAGSIRGGRGGLALSGFATALGLAVGVEALLFDAAIGVAVALRYLMDPAPHRPAIRSYAAALGLGICSLFLIQTPPGRWGVAVCDALGANLVAGVAVACLGLFGLTFVDARGGWRTRLAGLAVVGAVAGVAYAGLEPKCLHGPLGQADPRLGPIWLTHITEMRSLYANLLRFDDSYTVGQTVFRIVAAVAWLWLGRRRADRTFAWMLLGGLIALGVLAESQAQRMSFYTSWFATPLVAAAVAEFARMRLSSRLAPAVILAVALSPTWASAALTAREAKPKLAKTGSPADACSRPAAYARLAHLQPGIVLSEVDLGPYILMMTPHAVLAAPYHRMGWGIISADAALGAPPGPDEAKVRALRINYVVDCPTHAEYQRRVDLQKGSLQSRLDAGRPPAWLRQISAPGEPLRIYLVQPRG